jgi:hypothetical protein
MPCGMCLYFGALWPAAEKHALWTRSLVWKPKLLRGILVYLCEAQTLCTLSGVVSLDFARRTTLPKGTNAPLAGRICCWGTHAGQRKYRGTQTGLTDSCACGMIDNRILALSLLEC